jgi:hypothetical protein
MVRIPGQLTSLYESLRQTSKGELKLCHCSVFDAAAVLHNIGFVLSVTNDKLQLESR